MAFSRYRLKIANLPLQLVLSWCLLCFMALVFISGPARLLLKSVLVGVSIFYSLCEEQLYHEKVNKIFRS